jgi:Flp pilus assembly secretin CpaC
MISAVSARLQRRRRFAQVVASALSIPSGFLPILVLSGRTRIAMALKFFPRRPLALAAAAIFSTSLATVSSEAFAETKKPEAVKATTYREAAFNVGVDQTATLQLASPADSVVIGNAAIADVAVHDPNTLLITGKAFGSTNILVLGRGGNTIYSNTIAVADRSSNQITIVRGPGTYTYSCIEKCRGTPTIGDAPSHFEEVMKSVETMAGSARGQ